jgi:GTP-binding protein HflX
LVGYTNAGKSTLFNRLTESRIFAADQLFATLDPTLRRVGLPGGAEAILADTVGFVQNLPHALVDAFRATLEEAAEADVLLFVQDGAHPDRLIQEQAVLDVLDDIGAGDVPRVIAMNKVDQRPEVEAGRDESGRIWLSASTGDGLDALGEALADAIGQRPEEHALTLKATEGRLRAKLYAEAEVLSEAVSDVGDSHLTVRISQSRLDSLLREIGRGAEHSV